MKKEMSKRIPALTAVVAGNFLYAFTVKAFLLPADLFSLSHSVLIVLPLFLICRIEVDSHVKVFLPVRPSCDLIFDRRMIVKEQISLAVLPVVLP